MKKDILKTNFWTDRETTYLVENWGKKYIREIAKMLGKTPKSVSRKAARLRGKDNNLCPISSDEEINKISCSGKMSNTGKRWTSEEIDYLVNNWGTKSLSDISLNLKRTSAAINVKLSELRRGFLRVKNPASQDKPAFPPEPPSNVSVLEESSELVEYFPEIENYLRVIHRTLPKHWCKIPLEQRNTIMKGVLNMMLWCF